MGKMGRKKTRAWAEDGTRDSEGNEDDGKSIL